MMTALMLIDVQRNMLVGDEAVPDADRVRGALESLLDRARTARAAVVHVQNDGPAGSPDGPHTDGWQLVLPPVEGEIVVRKDQPDTFAANPALIEGLRQRGVRRLVIVGMQSEYCVAATGRAALREDLDVVLASGAHATYDDGTSAADISASVEQDLASGGAVVRPAGEIQFT